MTATQQLDKPATQQPDEPAAQQLDKPASRWTRTIRTLQHWNEVLAGI